MFRDYLQSLVGRTRINDENFKSPVKILLFDRREQAFKISLTVIGGNKDRRLEATASRRRDHRHELGALPG
jgi:hypothetical protein